MDNLARKEDLDREIGPFMRKISLILDPRELSAQGHEFLYRFPPQRGLEIASALTFANPFFMADIPAENVRELSVNLELLAEILMRAKLTAARAPQTNILVACMPKSASTFIQNALRTGLALPGAGLHTATFSANSSSMLGANLREQEPDELALLRNGLNQRGYVAQHHSRCSPYLVRLLGTYNVRPIVTYRNLFDILVSMDDMVMEWRKAEAPAISHYFNDAMPGNYHRLDRDDRLMMLAQRNAAWLVQFYVSWRKCEQVGLTRPLWISYEKDFLGDKILLARRIVDHLGLDPVMVMRLAAALDDRPNAGEMRLNQGVAGRGGDVPQAVRDLVLSVASAYAEDEDLTPIVGE